MRLIRATALAAALPLAAASVLVAQSDGARPTIPFFPLGTSPVALTGDARPGAYVSAVGRRAIAMGTEDGRFELWSWPLKWLHDFELSFRIPKYVAPIEGHSIARRVTERPEGLTIEYAYEQFTVKQHVFVPLDLPAVIMLLEVDAVRPMDVIARFSPTSTSRGPEGSGGSISYGRRARAPSSSPRAAGRSTPSSARRPSPRRPTSRRTCCRRSGHSSCSAWARRGSGTFRRASASQPGAA